MKVRGIVVSVVLVAAGLVTGCVPQQPARPDTAAEAVAAAKELRAARDKLAGGYRVEFEGKWYEGIDIDTWTWSGMLEGTAGRWRSSSDLRRDGQAFAHLESIQSGDIRYHQETGAVNFEGWRSVQGNSLGNYYWKPEINRGTTDLVPIPMPDADALLYLDIDAATKVTRSDLPGGGLRYVFDGMEWAPAEPLWEQFKRTYTHGVQLTVDVSGDGRPGRLAVTVGAGHPLSNVSLTLTVHAADAPAAISPPPSALVAPGIE
jgi:hypothetical protein